MLDLNKIKQLAKSYSPQELFATLVWQRQFNDFDGEQIITDLSNNPDLWHSFLFTRAIYAPDKDGLSFACMVTTLLAMANYRPTPETAMIQQASGISRGDLGISSLQFVAYPADTLYVLTENPNILVSKLIDLGKKWRADSVEVIDSNNEEYGYYTQFRLKESLAEKEKTLLNQSNLDRLDAVVVAYWWD